MVGSFGQLSEHFSRRQRIGIAVLGAIELCAKLAAARDIRRRSPGQLRGGELLWRGALLINTLGPLGYYLLGRRSS
jgi:hypothetical protein